MSESTLGRDTPQVNARAKVLGRAVYAARSARRSAWAMCRWSSAENSAVMAMISRRQACSADGSPAGVAARRPVSALLFLFQRNHTAQQLQLFGTGRQLAFEFLDFLRKQIEERKLADGIGLGRIWRIVPDGAPKANLKSGLATATTAQLVEKLGDANGWVRDTAQRLLVEKRDPAAVVSLRKMAVAAATPLARVHALWTLEGVGGLDKVTVLAALGLAKRLEPVKNCRKVTKADMVRNGTLPNITVNPQTFEVSVDNHVIGCAPATHVPLNRLYMMR